MWLIFAAIVRFLRTQRIASQFHTGWCKIDAWIFHSFGCQLLCCFSVILRRQTCKDSSWPFNWLRVAPPNFVSHGGNKYALLCVPLQDRFTFITDLRVYMLTVATMFKKMLHNRP